MIFSAEVSAVLLLFVVIIYHNDGVDGTACKKKVQQALVDYCASNGTNGDSESPALQKRQISPDADGLPGSPPPISDHDLSARMGPTDLDENISHPSRAAKSLPSEMEDYSARCCGEINDCSNPPASIVNCP